MPISTGARCLCPLNKLAFYYLGKNGKKNIFTCSLQVNFQSIWVHVCARSCVCGYTCTCTYVNKSMVYGMHMSVQVRGYPWCQVSFSKHSSSAFETESLAGTSAGRGRLTGLPELRSQMCTITVHWCF